MDALPDRPLNATVSVQTTPPPHRHPALVYLARLAPGSRPAQRQALNTIAELASGGRCDLLTLPWWQLRYATTQALRAVLSERYAPATVNRHLAALRGTLREAWRLGYLSAEDYHRAADLKAVRGEHLQAGRSLSQGELRALFAACEDSSAAGVRDAALLAVLYGAGVRRAEAVALELCDYDPATGELRVRRGKGGKQRLSYLGVSGRRALDAWLRIRGEAPGPVFLAVRKGGEIGSSRSITGQAVLYILRKRARLARLDCFSPHDLRRTFIGDLLDAGADISVVRALAGHANVQTTARYDRRPEKVRMEAAQLLHVPVGG